MVKLSALTVAIAATSIAPSLAFAPVAPSTKPCTSLHMTTDDVTKTVGSTMVAASLMLSNVFTPDAAIASPSDNFDFGPSSSLIAARSGGRAGGRSSYRAPPPSRSATTINRTTVINGRGPAVIAAPPVIMGGYGYSPFAPSPLGLGLGIAGEVGREMREYRQEDMIRQARSEAISSQQREMYLEQRIAQLEAQQNAQNAAAGTTAAPVTAAPAPVAQ